MKTNNQIEAGAPANVRPSSVKKYKITLLNTATGEAKTTMIVGAECFFAAWEIAENWKNKENESQKIKEWSIARIEVVL